MTEWKKYKHKKSGEIVEAYETVLNKINYFGIKNEPSPKYPQNYFSQQQTIF